MLCDELEGCAGEGREAQEGVDILIFIIIADLHCCNQKHNTVKIK